MFKSLSRIERLLWMCCMAALLLGALVTSQNYRQTIIDASARNDAAARQQSKLQEDNKKLAERLEQTKSRFVRDYDLIDLKKKGLKQPIHDLISDLQKHKELIPHKGVLGGTMGFYGQDDIHILSRKLVLAGFDDGHIMGKALLEYTVSQQGRISWKVIDSYIEQ